MRILSKNFGGFSLTELMIVVAIALILSVIGGISLNSRMKIAALEQAAQTMVSDLRYARSSAMFKNCPVRFVFCLTRDCTAVADRTTASIATGGGHAIGGGAVDHETPAQYYAIIRESQNVDPTGNCRNVNAIAADNWTYWDFDRRPQSIPNGVVFSPIYTHGTFDFSNWTTTTADEAADSMYFSQGSGQFTVPSFVAPSNGDQVAFQLTLDSCDPTAADCIAYWITVGDGGAVNMVKCAPDSANVCH